MNLSALCHTKKSFMQLDRSQRGLVAELALLVEKSGYLTPYEAKEFIGKSFAKQDIFVPKEIFEKIEPDDSLEVWTSDFKFIFAMGPILNRTSYTLEELATIHWSQLFERSEHVQTEILNKISWCVQTGRSVYNVTDWHLVVERQSKLKKSMTVKVKMASSFHGSNNLSGAFGLVKLKPQRTALTDFFELGKALNHRLFRSSQN